MNEEPLQRWEGVVLDVCEDAFTARLVDLTSESFDEECEIYLSQVPVGDRSLVVPGAVFHWEVFEDKATIHFKRYVGLKSTLKVKEEVARIQKKTKVVTWGKALKKGVNK